MLLRWIEKTRHKPKSVRNQYALIGATLITTIIVILWSVSLPTRFAHVLSPEKEVSKQSGAFSQFFLRSKDSLASVFSSMRSTDDESELTPDERHTTTTQDIPPGVGFPRLSEETIQTVKENEAALEKPTPKTVLIGTTSREERATTTDE